MSKEDEAAARVALCIKDFNVAAGHFSHIVRDSEWQVAGDISLLLAERERLREALTDFALVMDQVELDYAAAHKVICELQKVDPTTHEWPTWSTIANTLRWFDALRTKHGIRARAALKGD